jgi:RHS repeat-associated protein
MSGHPDVEFWTAEALYMRVRWYDLSTGQFLSRDPAVATTRSPYGYVGENPLNAADPLGLWGWNPLDDIKQAAGDVVSFAENHPVATAAIVVGAVAVTGGAACVLGGCEALGLVGAGSAAEEGAAAVDEAGTAAADAIEAAPKPPGLDPETWDLGPASRDIPENHWWDPEGGEWRWHAADKWHDTGHWDYNPWDQWNSPWQHLYPEDLGATGLLGFDGGSSCGG